MTRPSPLVSSWRGARSVRGTGEITTPAACTEICLAQPSICFAISMIAFTSGSFSYISLSSGVSVMARSMVMAKPC